MVNINDEFPSKFLKSADLHGQDVKVKISDVRSEDIGGDRRLIMYFAGKTRGMVLNKTNARTIADAYGDDTDQWVGADIILFSMKVDFQGRMVDGLRVRVPRQKPAPVRTDPNDRDREGETMTQTPPIAAYDDGLDDGEIPF